MANEKRLIDANALFDKLEQRFQRSTAWAHKAFSTALDDVVDAPTVDAVEVVRCKDCVKAVRHEVFPWSRRCRVEDCKFSHKETHFCSYGERKDNK